MNATHDDQDLEQRLRSSLRTVADALTEDALATPPTRAPARPSRRGRRVALGVAALAVPVALAAGAFVQQGPEYVDTIAPERIVMTGSVDGSSYLLVESDRTDACGRPVTGVELVEERENLLGSEWNTSGYEYGEHVERDCGGAVIDTSRYLEDPALFTDSGVEVGDSFVWVYAVHPDVDTVRITAGDDTTNLRVYDVDGAGYAPFEIPAGLEEYTSELLIDGQVVTGSREEQTVPRR
ncbi:hypothetical protein ASG88_12030 [Nocardioides sp. Soil777]|uniref:hypothetical protein n=1 Tax=Nocardioides sp. Soil777 TaxID=1736409 RepID=UPI000703A6A6|nr:hypothetical protein [Nocardioides sp. Soil777]KRF00112.1 hypothetical protein ASG88_12030 [Nocardioides sp. Soil777]